MLEPTFEILTGRSSDHLRDKSSKDPSELLIPIVSDHFYEWKLMAQTAGFNLMIASSYRSMERQRKIWNEKIAGKRPLKSKTGSIINPKDLKDEEMLETILHWTHIPGASRHHWGSDLDVFDLTPFEITQSKLQLENDEYEGDGPCANFNSWMESKCLKNSQFPFFRPYMGNLTLINSEKLSPRSKFFFEKELWHYSHKKMAQHFQKHYTFNIFEMNLLALQNDDAEPTGLIDLLLKKKDFLYSLTQITH